MNKYIVIIVLLPVILFGQTQYFTNENPACKWNANTESDLAGYIVYLDIHKYNVGIRDTLIMSMTSDTSFIVPDSLLFEADYRFGVRAIDKGGNRSIITWSDTQCYISPYACWYARYDTIPPSPTLGLKPGF